MSNKHLDMLGKKVRDRVTGFSGVVGSVSFDLYGCIQAAITPPVDDKGELKDGRWFDIQRPEVVSEERAMPLPTWAVTPAAHTHGPAEKPTKGRRP